MSTQEIAVAALGALHPGDVVVEGYRPDAIRATDGQPHGFVTVRREILPPLPTLPGYYLPLNPRSHYGETVVIELLNRPDRQWVDAGDRTYLSEDQVRDLLPLARLARVDDLLAEVAQIDLSAWADAREDLRKGLDELARRYGVHAYEVTE